MVTDLRPAFDPTAAAVSGTPAPRSALSTFAVMVGEAPPAPPPVPDRTYTAELVLPGGSLLRAKARRGNVVDVDSITVSYGGGSWAGFCGSRVEHMREVFSLDVETFLITFISEVNAAEADLPGTLQRVADAREAAELAKGEE